MCSGEAPCSLLRSRLTDAWQGRAVAILLSFLKGCFSVHTEEHFTGYTEDLALSARASDARGAAAHLE